MSHCIGSAWATVSPAVVVVVLASFVVIVGRSDASLQAVDRYIPNGS